MHIQVKGCAEKTLSVFSPRTQGGFTFVEVLTVLAILAIISTLTVAGFGTLAAQQQHEAEVNDIARSLSEQRTKTIASLGDTHYGIHVTANEIALFASSTPGEVPGSTATTTLVHSVASSDFSDGNNYLSFARITGAPSATGTIYLYSSKLDATSTITIYDSGAITQD